MGTSRDKKMDEVPVVSYGNLSLTEALISIGRFLVGNLKKIRGVSIRPKGKQEAGKDQIRSDVSPDGDFSFKGIRGRPGWSQDCRKFFIFGKCSQKTSRCLPEDPHGGQSRDVAHVYRQPSFGWGLAETL